METFLTRAAVPRVAPRKYRRIRSVSRSSAPHMLFGNAKQHVYARRDSLQDARRRFAFSSQANSSQNLQTAPLLAGLQTLKGEPVNMKADLGKKFWATWCPPCKASIPHLTQLAHKYRAQDVQFIGITDEPRNTVEPFIRQMGSKMEYTVALDDQGTAQEYMQRFHVTGIPHAFIVNRRGKIVWNGHPMDPGFEPALASAAAEPVPSNSNKASSLTDKELQSLSISELKALLASQHVSTADCLEKADLIRKLKQIISPSH